MQAITIKCARCKQPADDTCRHGIFCDIARGIFVKDDGGREEAGHKKPTGDCVTRAITIATGIPYQEVYDELQRRSKVYASTKRDRVAKSMAKGKGVDPSKGVFREVYDAYLKELGWVWTPTMLIGSGCKVHLLANELPKGRLITRLSRHVCAVVDGVIHDTYNPDREGTRAVYGYYSKP